MKTLAVVMYLLLLLWLVLAERWTGDERKEKMNVLRCIGVFVLLMIVAVLEGRREEK